MKIDNRTVIFSGIFFVLFFMTIGNATAGSERNSVIYEDRIVWQDDSNGNWDIQMYNISTSAKIPITNDEAEQQNPDIYGNRIVWQDSRNGGRENGDIYMYNISTSTETQVTPNKSCQMNPNIYGDRVVWADDRNGNWDIYMYNISTATKSKISNTGSANYPAIYENRIVWQDSRNGNEDIYMFTLDLDEVPPVNGNETENDTDNCTEFPDNEFDAGTDDGTDDETQIPDNCSSELTPLDRILALKEYVECTYKCQVKTKTGLATLLDTSMCHYENCDNAKAVSMLKSFIHLAREMEMCNQISADEADYMEREAKRIIDQIEAN
ncbi:beta propeller repeat-containing protein [Methanosarcina thermophila]|jgi:beta propeller repeat protein|uniref:Beta propeller repeat-containing protein n=3 Tax=Methanosarcina thermophila TaxID=2210 RepID=A0A1I6X7R3_METTE|nr:hypothetical protein [Methanosarcina thermophila]AKB13290.1 cell surface protein [Methanosarcina thermophila TM-1]AKB16075.1 cell surface protein [Methanosarcina thermophila CHTI-55]NLU57248.1 hypothetical protein [Methanosarcina thermophila]SFT34213.1 beta propeller repeat-containing protein [Methanosarcina thermophila]BAW28283.1 cell surface protein [Methanosarcina thermophila]